MSDQWKWALMIVAGLVAAIVLAIFLLFFLTSAHWTGGG